MGCCASDVTSAHPEEIPALTKATFDQMGSEMYSVEMEQYWFSPIGCLFACPEIEAGFWSIMREPFVVTTKIEHYKKEIVASCTSRANSCSYCQLSHEATSMVYGSGFNLRTFFDKGRDLNSLEDKDVQTYIDWAMHIREWDSEIITNHSFDAELAPELIGTVFGFCFANRVVETLIDSSKIIINKAAPGCVRSLVKALPGSLQLKMTAKVLGSIAYTGDVEAGKGMDDVQIMTDDDRKELEFRDKLHWAESNKTIQRAFENFGFAIHKVARDHIPDNVRTAFHKFLSTYRYTQMPISRRWANKIAKKHSEEVNSESDVDLLILMFLVAASPYQIDKDLLQTKHGYSPEIHDNYEIRHAMTAVIAYAAFEVSLLLCDHLGEAFRDPQ